MFEFLRSERVPMSRVDNAWLSMESPTNLMMITAVFVIEGRLDYGSLKDTFSRRFLTYRRFTQRPLQRASRSYWETDPNFDIETHLVRAALPGKADKAELQALTSRLASTPLDTNKAMWQVHLVENYGADSVLIGRIHHCYADGIALMQVLLSMTDETPKPQPTGRKRRGSRLRSEHGGVLERLYRPASRGLEQALEYASKLRDESLRVVQDPERAKVYLSDAYEVLGELAIAATLSDDPATRFRGRLGARKKVAWCEPISLAEVKTVAKALDCTVNDVLLTAVTGALRAYLEDKGDRVDGISIRATVPVNLRPLEHAAALGNHFGLVFLTLPIGIENPLERLYRIKQEMQEIKASKQAIMAFGALAAIGLAPQRVRHQAFELFTRKATAVMTNVPGPQLDLYFSGQRIRELMFWVPQSGSIGLGVSILSYNGQVQFGIITDMKLVNDPENIIDRFAGEFEKLLLTTLMEPWDETRSPAEIEATLMAYLERAEEDTDDGLETH